MIPIGTRVAHWQHGEGTITEILDGDCVVVLIDETQTTRKLSPENLTDINGLPFIKPAPHPPKPKLRIPRLETQGVPRYASSKLIVMPVVAPGTLWEDYLKTTKHFALRLDVHPDEFDNQLGLYYQYTLRELPEENYMVLDNKFGAQWRLWSRPPETVVLPFPIVPVGTGGRKTAGETVFIHHGDSVLELSNNDFILGMIQRGLTL